MLENEVNKVNISIGKPYTHKVLDVVSGHYILHIAHQSEEVFASLRSCFVSFTIAGQSHQMVGDILGVKKFSQQYGFFEYIGGGKKVGNYYVQTLALDISQNINELSIDVRTFLTNTEICFDVLCFYNLSTSSYKTNVDFFKSNICLVEPFLVNNQVSKDFYLYNVERGEYSFKIFHNNKAIFEKYKSLFLTFDIPNEKMEDIAEILGISNFSKQYGIFAYIGAGEICDTGYEQEVKLDIIQPLKELKISLNAFGADHILVDNCLIEKLPEEDKIVSSHSTITRRYPQYWSSPIEESDAFMFQDNIGESENRLCVLDKTGKYYHFDINDIDSLMVRLSLVATTDNYSDKQAILTINYFDKFGNNINIDDCDIPYSTSLKSYYYYLTVDPNYNNNIYLPCLGDVSSIKLGVLSWDNYSDIKFNGQLKTEFYKSGVSVIVPSYKGENTILKCLESLNMQTLPSQLFEIIIALNGPRDSTRFILDKFMALNPHLNIQVLELNRSGASYARNSAVKCATFTHVTFVDDDDYIDRNYLYTLFDKASWNNITLTGVTDVLDVSGRVKESSIMKQLTVASEKEIINYNDITSLLTMNACKMAPVHMVKSILYNDDLKSGEDVVYWMQLLSRFTPLINLSNNLDKAVYYRVITDNSVSRQSDSYDFNVKQRLDVITDLIKILDEVLQKSLVYKNGPAFIQSKINAQALFIKRYLRNNPNDYSKFQKEIIDRKLLNSFVNLINEDFTKRLVISYCFAPYMDTSAVVMCKRINQMSNPVDVVSNSMSSIRATDINLKKISNFNVGKHIELKAPQAFANWEAITKFSEMVVREIGNIISRREMYQEIYSRAMWPASHFAAALVKKKFPQVKWIAEFSDPLLMGVTAKERYEKLSLEWLYSHGFIESIDDITMNDNAFYWCEYLAYEYADNIIFTNENQRDYMLSYADEALQNKILEKSKIIPQPTLPTSYYDVSNIVLEKEPDIIYMAYFGSFYVNRGFDALFQAWKDLDNSQRKKLRLYVYTQQERDQVIEGAPEELKEFIIVLPYVGYFDFLALTKQFDILVVMDAQTKGLKLNNPYLPSKISDYLGSGSKILALVEKNSPMSIMQVAGLNICELQNTIEIQNIIIRNM